jgi:hypothetical protein
MFLSDHCPEEGIFVEVRPRTALENPAFQHPEIQSPGSERFQSCKSICRRKMIRFSLSIQIFAVSKSSWRDTLLTR